MEDNACPAFKSIIGTARAQEQEKGTREKHDHNPNNNTRNMG
jgi:hypothetical protein